jgi:predicted Fe-S protein YdhL (DUF1289 family)
MYSIVIMSSILFYYSAKSMEVNAFVVTLSPWGERSSSWRDSYNEGQSWCRSLAEVSKDSFCGVGNTSIDDATDSSNNVITTTTTHPSVSVTPCNRICRYNANIYNGHVCIGCFRETYEIAAWQGMSASEKYFTLMDAMDRLEQVTTPDNSSTQLQLQKVEGAISREELARQAEFWKGQGGDIKLLEHQTCF